MTDLPRCATCRHWIAPQDNPWAEDYRPIDWMYDWQEHDPRLSENVWGICRMTAFGLPCSLGGSGDYQHEHPESLAIAHDHEQYAAELLTRPDFGCIQHEPKDEA